MQRMNNLRSKRDKMGRRGEDEKKKIPEAGVPEIPIKSKPGEITGQRSIVPYDERTLCVLSDVCVQPMRQPFQKARGTKRDPDFCGLQIRRTGRYRSVAGS